MAYNEQLEKRLNRLLAGRKDFYSQKMFGGIGFLLKGNMCVGIYKDDLILRLGPPVAQKALGLKNVKPFDITGRPMKGWVMVTPAGIKTAAALRKWVDMAVDFVSGLPAK